MKNRLFLHAILLLIAMQSASAFIISNVQSSQSTYADGDLIELALTSNQAGLELTADFSKLDTRFNANMVLVETDGFNYAIYYPITYGNIKADGVYNVVISAYDPLTQTSSLVSYAITLNNELNRSTRVEEQLIKLKVRGTNISATIADGMVQICTPDKCTTLTEGEYEAARQIILSDDISITLENETYETLKRSIEMKVQQDIDQQMQSYLTKILEIHTRITNDMYDVKTTIANQDLKFVNQTMQINQTLKRQQTFNLIGTFLVICILVGSFYIFYLRTNTTWLS